MSVIFTNTPEQFQPVLSDGIFFTASADTTNTYNFRYIYDLYVNNQFVFGTELQYTLTQHFHFPNLTMMKPSLIKSGVDMNTHQLH